MKEQAPRLEREQETAPDDVMSENYEECPLCSYAPYEEQSVNESNCKVGSNPPTEGEREIERGSEQDGASEANDGSSQGEASELSETQYGYPLRPRILRYYKE
jgi:hypothetical protein